MRATTLAISLIAGIVLGNQRIEAEPQRPKELGNQRFQLNINPRVVGVWITNSPSTLYYNPSQIREAVSDLDAAGFNVIYPKDSGTKRWRRMCFFVVS